MAKKSMCMVADTSGMSSTNKRTAMKMMAEKNPNAKMYSKADVSKARKKKMK